VVPAARPHGARHHLRPVAVPERVSPHLLDGDAGLGFEGAGLEIPLRDAIERSRIDDHPVLRERGIAHSVEIYREGEPVGGLYGLTFGRLFHGESMYFREPDASKLALWALSEALAARGFALIDCQGATPHLLSLGAKVWPSARYLEALTLNRTAPSLHESWRDWTVTCLPARS